jgi:glutathione S-transferase
MGLYESSHPAVKTMRGLHLYHFTLSNCSQRVRIALEEKGLPWTSHHLDLPSGEHATEDYQSINPNGVVPTLVHDGQVVIESNDILLYLEEHFPAPPLRPDDAEGRRAMQAHIDAASAIQPAIKALSHALLFRPFRKVGPQDLAFYEAHHRDKELVAFLRDYADDGPAWRARVEAAHAAMREALTRLEEALGRASWLSGERFGLADISWVVNGHRLEQARYDSTPWPRLRAWLARAKARPPFERAVLSWRPEPA